MPHVLKLVKKIEETSDVVSFIFEPEEAFSWVPGQYLKYKLEDPEADDRGVTRYFTIASAPVEGHIQITTRVFEKSSTFKKGLQGMEVGGKIEADGPRGSFIYPDLENNITLDLEVIFIAGGIGVTPFRSILVNLDSKYLNPKITLLYANRDNSQIPFKDLFDQFSHKNDGLKIIYQEGPITPEVLQPLLNPEVVYYVSGPEPMVENIVKMLEDQDIMKSKIKTDFFPGYEDKL